jgi:hypothetical protein
MGLGAKGLVSGGWLLVADRWLLVVGSWWLVTAGGWLLVEEGRTSPRSPAPTPATSHQQLAASSPLTEGLGA